MTISCCRWTQPDKTINKKVSSGGTDPMLKVYRSCRPSIWTARLPPYCLRLPSEKRPFAIGKPDALTAETPPEQSIFGLRYSMTISCCR